MKIKDYLKENSSAKILALVVIASILILFYGIWSESRSGRIEIYIPERGASVFLDEKRVGIANIDKQTLILKRISPGTHSVLIYLEGYYPWEKTVAVYPSKNTKIGAFFVRKQYTSSYKKTNLTSEEKRDAISLFKENNSKKISFSGDGNVEINKDGGKIFASWIGSKSAILPQYFCSKGGCDKTKTILVFDSVNDSVDSIDFYPNREDIVLFSIKNSVYAIEIDKRGSQNFQPLYLSNNASFRISAEGNLFIKEQKDFFEIIL